MLCRHILPELVELSFDLTEQVAFYGVCMQNQGLGAEERSRPVFD